MPIGDRGGIRRHHAAARRAARQPAQHDEPDECEVRHPVAERRGDEDGGAAVAL